MLSHDKGNYCYCYCILVSYDITSSISCIFIYFTNLLVYLIVFKITFIVNMYMYTYNIKFIYQNFIKKYAYCWSESISCVK